MIELLHSKLQRRQRLKAAGGPINGGWFQARALSMALWWALSRISRIYTP